MTYDARPYWEERGKIYPSQYPPSHFSEQLPFIQNELTLLTPKSVLEFGCGYGLLTHILTATYSNAEIKACDFSKSMLEHAKKTLQGEVELFQWDITEAREVEKSELVIGWVVLQHITPEKIKRAVAHLTNSTSKWLVHIDYVGPDLHSDYQFAHNYHELFSHMQLVKEVSLPAPLGVQHFFIWRCR